MTNSKILKDTAEIKYCLDMAHTILQIAITGNGSIKHENGTEYTQEEMLATAFNDLDTAKAMFDDWREVLEAGNE